MFPETSRATAGCLKTAVRELGSTNVSFASTKSKIPITFGKLPMHECDFRTSYRDRQPCQTQRAVGQGVAVRDHLDPCAHSPSKQAGAEAKRKVCAILAAPLDSDQASRGRHGPQAVSPEPATAAEGGVASR